MGGIRQISALRQMIVTSKLAKLTMKKCVGWGWGVVRVCACNTE